MGELAAGAGLVEEALDGLGLGAERFVEDLEGDVPLHRELLGLEHGAHGAAADRLHDLVAGDHAAYQVVGLHADGAVDVGVGPAGHADGVRGDDAAAGGALMRGRDGRRMRAGQLLGTEKEGGEADLDAVPVAQAGFAHPRPVDEGAVLGLEVAQEVAFGGWADLALLPGELGVADVDVGGRAAADHGRVVALNGELGDGLAALDEDDRGSQDAG